MSIIFSYMQSTCHVLINPAMYRHIANNHLLIITLLYLPSTQEQGWRSVSAPTALVNIIDEDFSGWFCFRDDGDMDEFPGLTGLQP